MTRPDVTINGTKMGSLGWLRESIDFPPVQTQTSTTIVPGRDSPIRFSTINGQISYKPRTFKIVLVMSGYRDMFMKMVSAASQNFAGVLSKIILSERPDVYAYGTLQLAADYDTDMHKGTLTISCEDGDAYLYHCKTTTIKHTGSGTITLKNDFMPTVPTITVSAATTLSWSVGNEKFSKDLAAGTWTLPELELAQGNNSITVTTAGTVTVVYQEGCL